MTAWRNAPRNEAGQRPGPYQPGATPQVKGPKKQSQAPTARLNFQRAQMRVPHRLSKPFSDGSKKNIGYCREGMGQNSTSVLAGIEMERAFSALASPVRLPSPVGWAGIMGYGRLWRCPIPWCRSRCSRTLIRNVQTPGHEVPPVRIVQPTHGRDARATTV